MSQSPFLTLDRYRQAAIFSSPLLPAVVRAILDLGPVSRAQIARRAHLSKQTSSELVFALEQLGWVRAVGMLHGEVGRRAVAYEFEPRSAFVLGIDVGGAKLLVAVADHSGKVVLARQVESDRRGGLHLVQQIGAVADEVVTESGIERAKLLWAGIGTPGVVQRESGRIELAPNVPHFDEFDVVGALGEALHGIAVSVENDVNLAAIGESWNGLTRACDDVAFVALGTGVGMGLVSDGRLLRGAEGMAGEISYLPIGGDPFDAANVQRGTLETAIGSEGIRRRYVEAGGSRALTVKAIFDAVVEDAVAARVIDETARLLAIALSAVVALTNPGRVALGGSIGMRPELLVPLRSYLSRCVARPPEVTVSRLGANATVTGAIALALDEVHHGLFGVHTLNSALLRTKSVQETAITAPV